MISASVSGSGGPGSDPGGVTWLTCNNLGRVNHSHLLGPTKPFTRPRSINWYQLRLGVEVLSCTCGASE